MGYSENESQLKRIRKPSLLLSQEESLSQKVKKYPCLFDKSQKTYKERDVFRSYLVLTKYYDLQTSYLVLTSGQKSKNLSEPLLRKILKCLILG